MDKEENGSPFFIELFHSAINIFSLAILAMTITGIVVAR
jgi:hypothetical protein